MSREVNKEGLQYVDINMYTKQYKMHEEAIELMDDINHRLGTNHWMSLDEFDREFKHQFTNEEKEKVNSLLKRFEEL